jgi:hypothetical protein
VSVVSPAQQFVERIGRLAAALPDTLTALAYLITWLFPFAWGKDAVRYMMLVMLVEFLVVHSGGFLGVVMFDDAKAKMRKTLMLLGFGALYLLFAGGFALAFESWLPILTFAWLLGAKFAMVWLRPVAKAEERDRQMAFWGLSVAAYLAAVFAGVILPLPRLGLGSEIVPQLGLPGGGLWVEKPHTVIASGTLYFGMLALAKWAWRPEWSKSMRTQRNHPPS